MKPVSIPAHLLAGGSMPRQLRPTAAPNHWPYFEHRTVAEVERDEAAWDAAVREARRVRMGPGDRLDTMVGLKFDRGRSGARERAALPLTPCPLCGDRGFCGHAGRQAA